MQRTKQGTQRIQICFTHEHKERPKPQDLQSSLPGERVRGLTDRHRGLYMLEVIRSMLLGYTKQIT